MSFITMLLSTPFLFFMYSHPLLYACIHLYIYLYIYIYMYMYMYMCLHNMCTTSDLSHSVGNKLPCFTLGIIYSFDVALVLLLPIISSYSGVLHALTTTSFLHFYNVETRLFFSSQNDTLHIPYAFHPP